LHLNTVLLFEKYVRPALADCTRVLEIGPSEVPSRFSSAIANPENWEVADIAGVTIKGQYAIPVVMPDEYTIPADAGVYDAVFCANVWSTSASPGSGSTRSRA
jgi:hypothetical protein